MSEWQTYSVAELIESNLLYIGDGYRAKNSELSDSGLPFARSSTINNGFHFEDADYFPYERIDRVDEKVSRYGDVVFTSKGTVGRFAFVTKYVEEFVYSPQLSFWRSLDHDLIDPGFLYQWMHGREFFLQYHGVKGQTDMADYVSLRDQRSFHITLPPLEEQRAIAHILGSLDDKIEANRRMNESLEAAARAIFKSWFVDFDPVHYKSRGEQPVGMDAATADLFPDSFADSALGEIPAGWEVGTFDQSIEIISGGTPKTSIPEYWDGRIPWFSVKDAPSDSEVFVIDTERSITEAGVENSAAEVLPELTTIISARGTVGKLAVVGVPMAMNQSCYGIRGAIGYPDYFTYFHLKTLISELQQQTHGSVFDTITRKTFETIETVLPPQALARAFDGLVAPLLSRILNNQFESRTLAETRDALLPKLVSGEIRVGDVA